MIEALVGLIVGVIVGVIIVGCVIFLCDIAITLVSRGEDGLLVKTMVDAIKNFTERNKHYYPRIPFKTFEHLYAIAPDKWDIDDEDYVIYRTIVNYCYDSQRFEFSAIDSYRYQAFRKNLEKKNRKKRLLAKKEAESKLLEKYTKLWMQDIEQFAAENKKKMEAAKIENEEIIKRILGEKA